MAVASEMCLSVLDSAGWSYANVTPQKLLACRVNRRKFKLAEGEDSESRSNDDFDSGNDAKLKSKRKRPIG